MAFGSKNSNNSAAVSTFKSQNSFGKQRRDSWSHSLIVLSLAEERVEQCKRVNEAHSGKIPVIVEKAPSADVPNIDKIKYLVPGDLTVAQFLCLIRNRIKLANDQALFIYVNGTLPATSAMFSTIYEEHKDSDGFLYVVYTGESSFGAASFSDC